MSATSKAARRGILYYNSVHKHYHRPPLPGLHLGAVTALTFFRRASCTNIPQRMDGCGECTVGPAVNRWATLLQFFCDLGDIGAIFRIECGQIDPRRCDDLEDLF